MKLKPMTPARLRQWRILRGLTVTDAYKLFHVSRMTYFRMENTRVINPYLLALAVLGLEFFLNQHEEQPQ